MKRIVRIGVTSLAAVGLVLLAWGCQAKPQAAPADRPTAKAAAPAPQPEPAKPKVRDVAFFLQRMVDVEWLAHYEPGVTCKQFSSYDRATRIDEKGNRINWEANGDAGHYLRTTPQEGNVMAEMVGPGCITQIWSANPGGTIRIWLDDAKTPSIEIPMAELLSDQGTPPFKEPYCYQVRPTESNQTASNCYFPIPYAKSCKVAVVGHRQYYHVDHITYPKDTPVVTLKLPLTPEQQKVCDEVADKIAARMSPSAGPSAPTGSPIVITPGKEVEIAKLSCTEAQAGAGGILRQLTIKADSPDKYRLRKAVLKIYYDGDRPGVVAPLGDFFGTGWFPTAYQSMMSRIERDGTMTCDWPMPFKTQVRVTLRNLGNMPLSVRAKIWGGASPRECTCKPMYFHAMYRREKLSTTFDYPFVQDLVGPGRYVGTLLNIDNPKPGWWGEGDEKAWVDGEKFPSWYGTGSEDYFCDAWGMHGHARPYEGCPLIQEPAGHHRKTSMYRWHVLDSIPFAKSFTMTIENYYKQWGRVPSDYSSVAYYYDVTPAVAAFFKPLTLADLLPITFRPEGTIEAETLPFPSERKRTIDTLARLGAADQTSGTGAVELTVPAAASEQAAVPLGDVKTGVYRLTMYLFAAKEMPGLSVIAPKKEGVSFQALKLPSRIPTGASSQQIGMLFVTADKPAAVTLGLRTTGKTDETVYLDAIQVESPPTHGIEAEWVKWSSPDHLVSFERVLGDLALSGWGEIVATTESVGGLLAMPVTLKTGFYGITARLRCGPDFGQLRIRMDLGNRILNTYDGYAEEPGLKTHSLGRFEVPAGKTLDKLEFMICGKNPKSTGTRISIDYIDIVPCKNLTGYEGEDMPVIKLEHGGVDVQELGASFSRGAQKFITFGDKTGRVQLGFDVPKAGAYDVEMAFCKSFDYATIQAYIDGKPVGPQLDNYSPTIVHSGPVNFGKVDLAAGPHVLEFRVVGRNAKSGGYYMGFDYLNLKPAK